jgi:hypothetical protein
MLDNFIEALPDKVRSTDDFDLFGTKFRKKQNALKYRYVEANQFYKKFIILDLDKPGSAFLWEDRNLPPPSIVIVNPENAHSHYLYELNTPVYYTEESRRAPQKYFENVDSALTDALGADLAYVGKFVKNPLHPSWRTITHRAKYDLQEFSEYLDISSHRNKIKLQDSLYGRNTILFHNLRLWAYQEVKLHTHYTMFQARIENHADSLNKQFVDCSDGVLPAKEVLSVAKSVGKWTWKHRFGIGDGGKRRGIMSLSDDLSLQEKQIRAAKFTNDVRTESIDEKIKLAIHKCKTRGFSLTSGNLEKFGLSRSTFSKYKNSVHKWIQILTT